MGKEGENAEKGGNGNKLAPRSMLSAVRSVFAHARPLDGWLMGLGLIGAIGDGVSMPIMSIIMIKTVNSLGAGPSSPGFEQAISQSSLNLVYLSVCCFALSLLEGYCWTRTGERQASRMRRNYLKAVLRQDVGYFDLKFASVNEVVTSISSNSLIIQDVLSEKVPNFVMHCAYFFGSYIASFILLWRLTLVALPAAVLLLLPGMMYGRILLTLAREIQEEYNKAGMVAQQAFSSIRTVYSFAAERRTVSAFSAALDRSVRLGRRQGFVKGLALGNSSVTFAISALVLWYSSRLVMYHGADGGTIFAVGLCIVSGGISFGLGLSNVKHFGEAMAAAERMEEVIMRQPQIDSERGEGEEMERVEGVLEFKEVRFAYPARQEAEVLRGFSLRVEAGKMVALVGGSGSGKSTAIALLQRFYNLDGGEITLDGVDIRRLRLKWLRAQMGLVSQEPALFAATIKENILFGKEEAAMDEVVAAAKAANAHGFISELPLGYDTQVGERGIQMSGGQKQRLAIARAIVRAPKILLLDEATSALDVTSEHIVQAALDAASVGRTTLVIAHRLSTIRNADSIAFVQAGQVTELGSHDQLLTNLDGHYSTLFRIQQSHPPPDDQHFGNGVTERSSRSMSRRISISSSTRSTGEARWGEDEKSQRVQKKLPASSLLRLMMMNAPEWRQAIVGGISALIYGGVQPTYSYFLGSFLMVYFLKDPEEIREKTRAYSLIFVGLFVLSFAVNVLQHYNLGVMGECLTRRVRERMISKMLTFEVGWFDREENSTGAICSRLARDANMVRSLVGDRMSLLIQVLSAMTVACTLGLIIAWRIAIVMIATQPMTIICFYAETVLKAMSKKAIEAQSESSTLAAEAVGNIRTITAFSSQHRILHLFDLSQNNSRQSNRHCWVAGISLASSKSLNNCIWALGYWYGGILVSQGYITSKELIQTFMIIMSTGRIIAQAGSMTADFARDAESVASVFSVLDHITSIEPDDPEGHPAETITGAVELCGIEFAYPARPDAMVLSRFSLSIEAGRSTALVGSSGCGKSTIISLIERFYDPLRGVVRIDGRDIRSYHLWSLRRHISLVGQEPTLVAGTIRENIMYGVDEASDAELEAAARAANVHEFISGLKDGYGTLCGEQGIQLSGGQKQRVAIARAILKNPAILLLDEATSALDGQSEKLVQEALEKLMIGRTSVVVAHRLSTIRNCDVIAVLHKGRLVEKGSHASLLLKGIKGSYYRLVKQQTSDHKI